MCSEVDQICIVDDLNQSSRTCSMIIVAQQEYTKVSEIASRGFTPAA